ASAAATSSIATTRRAFSSRRRACRTATVPMPTTSWLLALVGTEPSEAGCASTAVSATVALAQYCRPQRPLRRPTESRIKNGGRRSLVAGSSRRASRRSENSATSASATFRWSAARARGWPWKLPACSTASSSGKKTGLSVTAVISTVTTSRTGAMGGRTRPGSWGRERGAEHLGYAAQRVRVLDRPGTRLARAPAGLRVVQAAAAREQRAQVGRRRELARLWAHAMHPLVEGLRVGAEDLEDERRRGLGRCAEAFRADHDERGLRGLARRPVHHRQRLAAVQRERRH